MAPDADLVIVDLLHDLGFSGEDARRARAAIEEAGLTNSKKVRIAASKLEAVKRVLAERYVVLCNRPSCRQSTGLWQGRTVIDAARPAACNVCKGSPNAAAVDRAIGALGARGWRRVVVVGGSPSTREELRALVGDRLELRLVSGTDRRTGRDAAADLAWADLVAIWGGTELDHKISKLYTDASTGRVVTCPLRGIEAMAATWLKATEQAGRR